MRLPTREEINPWDDLDGQRAEQHFYGKTLEEAESLFREASLVYQEDLMFMGSAAFRFYVQAATNYIRSDAGTGDPQMLLCFAGILEHRLEFETNELAPIAAHLSETCAYILQKYDQFGVEEVCGDLRPRFQALEKRLRSVILGQP